MPKKPDLRETHEDKKAQKLVERINKKQAPKEKSVPSQEDRPPTLTPRTS